MSKRNILFFLVFLSFIFLSCMSRGEKKVNDDKAYTLLEKVAELNACGDKQGAVRLADSVIAMSPADSTLCWTLSEKTVALTDMGRMPEAVATGKQAIELAQKTADVEAEMNLRGALGIAYRRQGLVDSALAEYDKGIELAVRGKNSEYEIYLDNCAAVLFCDYNRFAEALEYSTKAEKAALAAGDTVEWLSARANIGGVYLRQNKFKMVVKVMEPLWHEVEKTGYNVLILKYLSPMLKAYDAIGCEKELKIFMTYADKAMQGVSATSNGVLGIMEIKAGMLSRQRRYGEQLALLDTMAAANAQNHAMPEERLLAERAKCLWQMKHSEEAFALLQQAYLRLDSVKHSDVERGMSEFAVKYNMLEKEMKIEQMRRHEIELQNRILWLALAVFILCLVICVIVYQKRVAAQRATLEKERSYIRGLENERSRLAKELHDGVCNDMLAAMLLMRNDTKTAERQLKDCWRNARNLSHALMPPSFSHTTLSEAVRAYAMAVGDEEKKKVRVSVGGSGNFERLPQQTVYELYRIIQELVANALCHGDGSGVDVELNDDGTTVCVRVENNCTDDNSAGESQQSGIGKETVIMRATSIGAKVCRSSEKGKYSVEVRI